MDRRTILRVLLAYAVTMFLLILCLFALRTFFGPEAMDLHDSTPAIANQFTYEDIRVPGDADSVFLYRGYYPPRIWIRFHADKAQIETWVASRLAAKSYRQVPIARGFSDTGISWFNPNDIRHGRAFLEDETDEGERIFVDCERSLVLFSD